LLLGSIKNGVSNAHSSCDWTSSAGNYKFDKHVSVFTLNTILNATEGKKKWNDNVKFTFIYFKF
jgi:hypothetical protein